jgi:hypothetical protein
MSPQWCSLSELYIASLQGCLFQSLLQLHMIVTCGVVHFGIVNQLQEDGLLVSACVFDMYWSWHSHAAG